MSRVLIYAQTLYGLLFDDDLKNQMLRVPVERISSFPMFFSFLYSSGNCHLIKDDADSLHIL